MSLTKAPWAWIDVETTGLDAENKHLLEIACVVTDANLNVLDDAGFQAVIRYSAEEVVGLMLEANEYVVKMHQKTGLWDRLTNGTPVYEVDSGLRDYLARFAEPRTMPVAGNSVRLDMNFIDRHLPLTSAHLDYHMRDVSSVAGMAGDWYDLPWFDKHSDHTAMTDIRESIRELRHYRDAVFLAASDRVLLAHVDIDDQPDADAARN